MHIHKIFFHLFMSFTVSFALLQSSVVTNTIHETPYKSEQTFKQKADAVISDWLQQVSQDKEWQSFTNACWNISSLGPGTHSFLVTLYVNDDNSEELIGYIILHVAETGGLFVGEYGKGHFEGLQTYYERPFSTVYYNPFESIYIDDNNEIHDLYTNEIYPIELSYSKKTINTFKIQLNAESQLIQLSNFNYATHIPYFSPYETLIWLTSPPINSQLEDDRSIETELEFEQPLYYRIKTWNKKISTVFSITSIHKWNDRQLFIGLQLDDEDTIRYIPYTQLLELGLFYSPSSS